ncbi:MAG: NUDIX hydrolase [Microthrixaceae bacterium]
MSGTFRHDHPDPSSVPVRDAATVMLVRDGDDGLEVCLMQRNLDSDFVGGAMVFPGGGLDEADAFPAAYARCAGRGDAEASRLLDLPADGLSYWVAVVRESFEEAGVLLARTASGDPVDLADEALAARCREHRRAVDTGERTLAEVLEEEDLYVAAGDIHYFSRWITPLGAPRRYDTRFFVAAAPGDQEVTHDDRELIGTHWSTPAAALARQEAGEITLIFPTVRSLVALDRFATAGEVLAHSASLARVEPVLPTITESPDGVRIVLPGDPEHTGGRYDASTARPVTD